MSIKLLLKLIFYTIVVVFSISMLVTSGINYIFTVNSIFEKILIAAFTMISARYSGEAMAKWYYDKLGV